MYTEHFLENLLRCVMPKLDGIGIDHVPLEGFDKNVYSYTVHRHLKIDGIGHKADVLV